MPVVGPAKRRPWCPLAHRSQRLRPPKLHRWDPQLSLAQTVHRRQVNATSTTVASSTVASSTVASTAASTAAIGSAGENKRGHRAAEREERRESMAAAQPLIGRRVGGLRGLADADAGTTAGATAGAIAATLQPLGTTAATLQPLDTTAATLQPLGTTAATLQPLQVPDRED